MKILYALAVAVLCTACSARYGVEISSLPKPKTVQITTASESCYDGFIIVHIPAHAYFYKVDALGRPIVCPK